MRRFLLVGGALAVLALGSLLSCSPRAIEAQRLLADIAGHGGAEQTAAQSKRSAIIYQRDGRQRRGDLYLPEEGMARAGLVVVPGAARTGKDDPRLVALANSLTRAQFAVLVPDIPSMRALKVTADNQTDIADAAVHLSSLRGGQPVGVVAISYAVGPAIMAALAPDSPIRFIVGVGGYYDLTEVLTFFTTGQVRDRPGAPWRPAKANDYGKWVFVMNNAERLTDPRDRTTLQAMAGRKLDDLGAPIEDLVPLLGAQGRPVYDLLANRDPDRVPQLIAALPAPIRDELRDMDLSRRDLSPLRAKLLLIHGRDDAIIPVSQSVALAAAVPPGQADLFLADSLAHADVGPAGLTDSYSLWRAAHELLTLRDELPLEPRQ